MFPRPINAVVRHLFGCLKVKERPEPWLVKRFSRLEMALAEIIAAEQIIILCQNKNCEKRRKFSGEKVSPFCGKGDMADWCSHSDFSTDEKEEKRRGYLFVLAWDSMGGRPSNLL